MWWQNSHPQVGGAERVLSLPVGAQLKVTGSG
jgi:hypothetical protein